MIELRKGRFRARLAKGAEDVSAAQALRQRVFRAGRSGMGLDSDRFDPICTHVLVEDTHSARLVCCFRLLLLDGGAQIEQSYAAQFYDLSALSSYPHRMSEVGRFCIDPGSLGNPDIMRLAWATMTQIVDGQGVAMLFGCSSFAGTAMHDYAEAFALLRDRHFAPSHWRPGERAADVIRFTGRLRQAEDAKRALRVLPPLLRSYLSMGGWVSDHAVVDHDLDTLHVFTGLEVATIPAARARLLRGMVA